MSRVTTLKQASSQANKSSTSLVTPQVSAWSNAEPGQVESHLYDLLTQQVCSTLSNLRSNLVLMHCEKVIQTMVASQSEFTPAQRLEKIGYRIGWLLSERLLVSKPLLPRTMPSAVVNSRQQQASAPPDSPDAAAGAQAYQPAPVIDALECIKFVCKDVWTAMFDKQVDNLRTNHRGVWVIQDNAFRPLLRVAGKGSKEWSQNVRFSLLRLLL